MKTKEAIITVGGLRVHAWHGALEQERQVGNEFIVDIMLVYPAQEAIEKDNLSGTVNYAEVIEVVKAEMARPSQLLEHVCGRIAEALTGRWPEIVRGSVKVAKPKPPIPGVQLDEVAVEVSW